MNNKRVCVFCASSNHCSIDYFNEAFKLGEYLADTNRNVIYGGGNVGLMKSLADGFISKRNNSKITGVIPKDLMALELGHKELDELIVVDGMHPREDIMLTKSDCIIALPGGCGTFSELMQAITWKRLNIIKSPIIIYNYKGFFNGIISQLNKSIEENFMNNVHGNLWTIANNANQLIDLIESLEPVKENLKIITERNYSNLA